MVFIPQVSAQDGATSAKASEELSLRSPVTWLLKPLDVPNAEAATETAMKPYTEKIPSADVKFDMVPIPGGKFLMGSPESEGDRKKDEGPQVEVGIEPFWMGKFEVTWEEYELWGMGLDKQIRKVTGAKSSEHDTLADAVTMPTKPYADMSFGMGKDRCPAICMTQLAAKMYCKWLSAKTGRYYRLPTEAEWEYACRAGTKTAYSFGDDAAQLGDYAWYYDNCDDKYHKVGEKKPNPWGLHDMHGNVAEWVLDQHTPDGYTHLVGKLAKNPLTFPTKSYKRVVRGGSWFDDADECRSASRMASDPEWKQQDPQIPQSIWYFTDADFVGFRVIRPLRTPTSDEAMRYDIDPLDKDAMIEYREMRGNVQ
jgi:formylglycine-generating enzyme required for sulfatase activity